MDIKKLTKKEALEMIERIKNARILGGKSRWKDATKEERSKHGKYMAEMRKKKMISKK
jgi:hypothetical protein